MLIQRGMLHDVVTHKLFNGFLYAELGEQNGINEGSNDPKVLRLYIQVRSS